MQQYQGGIVANGQLLVFIDTRPFLVASTNGLQNFTLISVIVPQGQGPAELLFPCCPFLPSVINWATFLFYFFIFNYVNN